MTEHRVVPASPDAKMAAVGVQTYHNLCIAGVPAQASETVCRSVYYAMVHAAPPTGDGEALRASLATFPADEVLERYRKKLRELADDMAADAENQVKESLAPNLVAWVEDLATRAVDALLRGNAEQIRRYLHCDGYNGRGRDQPVGFRTREPHEWHPLIGGRLSEADFVALRRGIVEAHRDLITEQRVLDLEDQVKSLVAQANRKDNEIERLRGELRVFR